LCLPDGVRFKEITAEEEQVQISAYESQLAQIDRDALAGRAIRELVLELAERVGIEGEAVEALRGYETIAEPIRADLRPLLQSREAIIEAAK
jgi:hypothetical protein